MKMFNIKNIIKAINQVGGMLYRKDIQESKDLDRDFKKTYCLYCTKGVIKTEKFQFICLFYQTSECLIGELQYD